MGQKKLTLLTRIFFTWECMVSFAKRPKISGRKVGFIGSENLFVELKLRSLITAVFRWTTSLYKNFHWKHVDLSFQRCQSPVGCFSFHPETSTSEVASQKEAMPYWREKIKTMGHRRVNRRDFSMWPHDRLLSVRHTGRPKDVESCQNNLNLYKIPGRDKRWGFHYFSDRI